jgi:hypothetical protein
MYSQPPHNALSFREGVRMIHGNMNAFDPVGGSDNFVKRQWPLRPFLSSSVVPQPFLNGGRLTI